MSLQISIVTSVFPAPSEAFAAVEIRKLIELGHSVAVHSLRPEPPDSLTQIKASELGGLDVTWMRWRTAMSALAIAITRPRRTIRAFAWLIQSGFKTPKLLMRAVVLFPRMLEIASEIEQRSTDVVHLFWGHYPSVVGFLLRESKPSKIVITMSLGAYDLLYRFGPSIHFSEQADIVWTHSEANIAALRDMGISTSRIAVLPRGIDLAHVHAEVRKSTGLITTIARLVPEKGVALVVRAFAQCRSVFPDCKLQIIGTGPELQRLKSLVGELQLGNAVQFLGALPHRAVYEELSRTDIFVLASRNPSERLPNVVKEALASRCICVVTHSPGIEDLLQPLQHQLVVEPSTEAISTALVSILSSPESYSVDRELGRAHMIRQYDATRVAQERVRVWTDAYQSRRQCLDHPDSSESW